MKKYQSISIFVCLSILVLVSGCIEELDFTSAISNEGSGLLVVEATLTDKIENQRVLLSRSEAGFDLVTDTTYNRYLPFGLGDRDSVDVETNANVKLMASDGKFFQFIEVRPGIYESIEQFGLASNVDYVLNILLSNGIEYESENLILPDKSEVKNVYARCETNDQGVEGIQIYMDSDAVSGNPNNFRYIYEETYKIMAPDWVPKEFRLTNYDPCALPLVTYDLDIVEREVQNKICYNTVPSTTIIQTTSSLNESNDIDAFPIRFIPRNNFIISHRYSILIKQYVQSEEASSFFGTLKTISESDNIFSDTQPGPLTANVSRTDNNTESVFGYVEAVSSSERRLFFDYDEFFEGEELPPYPFLCTETSSLESHISYCFSGMSASNCPISIIEQVNLGLISYKSVNDQNLGSCPGPYTYVPRVCGDCTLLGSNTIPEFWIE